MGKGSTRGVVPPRWSQSPPVAGIRGAAAGGVLVFLIRDGRVPVIRDISEARRWRWLPGDPRRQRRSLASPWFGGGGCVPGEEEQRLR